MLIYIVRHGETDSNVHGLFQGWSEDPLNENGVLLAEISGRNMRGIHFDCCISSPLQRAAKTAEIILKESGNPIPVTYDDRLKEINMGDWEHKSADYSMHEVDKRQLELFFNDTFQFSGCPNGENVYQVMQRTQAFLKELTEQDDGKSYLISTHAFALRAMLNYLYEDPSDFWHGRVPYNCCVNVIEVKNGKVSLVDEDKVFYDPEFIVNRYVR